MSEGASRVAEKLGRISERVLRGGRSSIAWLRARPWAVVLLLLGAVVLLATRPLSRRSLMNDVLTATVDRGTLVVRLTEAGVLKPAQSITYRSPLAGREAEIIFLAPEGTRVNKGDLLVRLETNDLARELEAALQAIRQAEVDVQINQVELQDARARLESLMEGQGALAVDEAQSSLTLAEKKVKRLRAEYESLEPLLDKGFITREELDRTAFELEQAEAEVNLSRRKTQVYIERTHPHELQQAQYQLAQKEAQLENARAKLAVAKSKAKWLAEAIEGCSIYARQPGLVIHEEYLAANPRRKIRVGDRVTRSQGLITIPEVERMLVEASVREADVYRVRPGQPASIQLDAFPGLKLSGQVVRVGTLARSSLERPYGDKRFDLVVEIDPTEEEIRPEMTARADIVVAEREDVLLLPINAVFERSGVFVCHVLGSWGVETRPVELGDSNGLYVEVLGGLQEGERVALQDLSSTASSADAPEPQPKALHQMFEENTKLAPQ